MKQQRTDNSETESKVLLRTQNTKEGSTVLDCYHGEGLLWGLIKKEKNIKVIGIEAESGKGFGSMYGKCEKIIPSIDLSVYDVIDFDSWGSPYKAIKAMFKNKTLKKGTICFYTYIQTGMGRVENDLLYECNITKNMVSKCSTLFKRYGFKAFKSFLYNNGIREIENIEIITQSIKNYGYFVV